MKKAIMIILTAIGIMALVNYIMNELVFWVLADE